MFPLDRWPAYALLPTEKYLTVSLRIVQFCAEEVRRQRDTPWHVWRMVDAWAWALANSKGKAPRGHMASPRLPITRDAVLTIAAKIDEANEDGYREGAVWVGDVRKPDQALVSGLMADLLREQANVTPEEFYRQFEEIHPFGDGNGRTGKVLYNWLRDSLGDPTWPPSFWGDVTNP